ncbi:DUF4012 domain-containing protein [Candidatus Woesebacteria bacterium]|nr:DUF4012 domain-containing protein [Candidatus Woesebacteria bacterium]
MDIPKIKLEEPPNNASSILVPKVSATLNQSQDPGTEVQQDFLKKEQTKIVFNKKPVLYLIGIIIGMVALLGLFVGAPVLNAFNKAKALSVSLKKLEESGKSKDLSKIKAELKNTRTALGDLDSSLNILSWVQAVPFVGGYVADAKHATVAAKYYLDSGDIFVATIDPYADLVGLKGGESSKKTDSTQTTKDRIDFIIKSLPVIIPKTKDLADKVALAKKEIDYINPNHYPVSFQGKQVRSQIARAKDLADQGSELVIKGRPLFEAAPYLLGADSSRNYLLLFMNDKELRPTGGFLTAYAIMKVDKGKVEPVSSSDIYNLDANYKPVIPAPDPLIKYLRGPYSTKPYLLLRDMNWSPDFTKSMDLFSAEAQKVGVKNIDGIIAVDTHLLVNLLDVIGQIGVPGFGNFSTKTIPECNCPQVIHELESFADVEGPIVWDPAGTGKIIYRPPNSDNRKKIIGPLMNSILANVLGQPKDKLPDLFQAGFKSIEEKHVLLYMKDEKVQKAVQSFGIGGNIVDYKGDYMHINDANLGGRKSNLYTSQEVEQKYSVGKDGFVEKTVTITYKNPEKQDGWLNSILPNWVRVYVPKGSSLISMEGVDDKQDSYEDLGKTVFAGFFRLRPQGVSTVILKYKLPIKAKGSLNLLVQKQPGTDKILFRTIVGKNETEEYLKEDKEFKLSI